MPAYAPERGELVWIRFPTQAGHEQRGRRPALIVSPQEYNRKIGLALMCPITSVVKGYPFEVILPEGSPVQGAVLCDHIKSLDWRARRVKRTGEVSQGFMEDVTVKLLTLIDPR